MVGVEIAVAAFTNPIFDRLPDDAYRAARSDGSRVLSRVMPFWCIATLVVLIATAVITSNWLVTAAAALMALVALVSRERPRTDAILRRVGGQTRTLAGNEVSVLADRRAARYS